MQPSPLFGGRERRLGQSEGMYVWDTRLRFVQLFAILNVICSLTFTLSGLFNSMKAQQGWADTRSVVSFKMFMYPLRCYVRLFCPDWPCIRYTQVLCQTPRRFGKTWSVGE